MPEPLIIPENSPSNNDNEALSPSEDTTQLEALQELLEKAHNNEEAAKIENARLRMILEETQNDFQTFREEHKKQIDAFRGTFETESLKLKNIILKQCHMIKNKDNEIMQLQNRLAYTSHPGKSTFFREAPFESKNDTWEIINTPHRKY